MTIRITRRRLDRAGYEFRFTVWDGRLKVASFDGSQLDPRGPSIGQAEADAKRIAEKARQSGGAVVRAILEAQP